MQRGYCLHIDILGTKEMLKNLSSKVFWLKMKYYEDTVSNIAQKHNIMRLIHYSDTLHVYVDDNLDSLSRLIDFSRELVETCLEKSLPLRGAIIYGIPNEFTELDLSVQKALMLEKMQDWIGVIVDIDDENAEKFKDKLVIYPIHSKNDSDPIKLFRALKWNVPSYDKLVEFLTKDGLGGVPGIGKDLTWEFARKVTNTILFGIWVESGQTMDRFYCGLPIAYVDKKLRKH